MCQSKHGPNISEMRSIPITAEHIQRARKLLEEITHRTPMELSRCLSELAGVPVYLKCENLQRTGSFKIRGSYIRISGLSVEQRRGGVTAASAGNHAQGVALAATLLNARSTIFMPFGSPLPKIKAAQDYGAEVRMEGRTVAEAMEAAQQFSEETRAVLIEPFDDWEIITGQATVGMEILEQCPEVRTILVGLGGGGLLAGLSIAVRAARKDVRVIGVQAETAASFPPSLAAGEPVTLEGLDTLADGIAVERPGDITFPVIRELAPDVRTVSEKSISAALLLSLERLKLVAEPAGVASVAALLQHTGAFDGPVVAVLTGGNVDQEVLQRILRRGLSGDSRYLALRVRMRNRPDGLARLHEAVARAHAGALSTVRVEADESLDLTEVQVDLKIAVEGREHGEHVRVELADAGFENLVADSYD